MSPRRQRRRNQMEHRRLGQKPSRMEPMRQRTSQMAHRKLEQSRMACRHQQRKTRMEPKHRQMACHQLVRKQKEPR